MCLIHDVIVSSYINRAYWCLRLNRVSVGFFRMRIGFVSLRPIALIMARIMPMVFL